MKTSINTRHECTTHLYTWLRLSIPLNSLNTTKPMGLKKTHWKFNVVVGVQIITRAILVVVVDVVSCLLALPW
jgi:hypothetical protein